MRRVLLLAFALLACGASSGRAALTRADLARVQAAPVAGASLPLDLPLEDLNGGPARLGEALGGRPGLLILADWRCTQLCGSILGIAAGALRGDGLVPGRDFAPLMVGFNPDATAADARAMVAGEAGADPGFAPALRLLTASPASLNRLESALGFTAIRDAGAERYAHPADLYVLTADGRVSRVLNALSIDPDTLRLALVEAGEGRIGTLVDRLHVLCYGLDPLTGASTGLAQTMLRSGASLLLVVAAGCGAVVLRRHRAARGARS